MQQFNLYQLQSDGSKILEASYSDLTDAQMDMASRDVSFLYSIEVVDLNTGEVAMLDSDASQLPNTDPTPLEVLQLKAVEYMAFGSNLFGIITQKVWAVNVLAKNNGQPLSPSQLLSLLQSSTSLQQTLESGSLATALYVISQLVAAFPQYSDIGSDATNQINQFMAIPA